MENTIMSKTKMSIQRYLKNANVDAQLSNWALENFREIDLTISRKGAEAILRHLIVCLEVTRSEYKNSPSQLKLDKLAKNWAWCLAYAWVIEDYYDEKND